MPLNSRYNRPFTERPPLTVSARLASDPVGLKSGGQTRFRTGVRSEALFERNLAGALPER
jgi:hypothetical protein